MSDFDGYTYERERNDQAAAVAMRVLELLEERHIEPDRAPLLRMDCPLGHKLGRYRLAGWEDDGGRRLSLEPVSEEAAPAGVAHRNSPFKQGRTACLVPGCPELVDHDGYCEGHGGRPVQTLDHLRTEWTCRLASCGWHGPVTRAQLLRVYGMALVLGADRMPVTGKPATPRKR